MLVDQHAAHERILFEELRRRMEEKGVPSQRLLLPQVIELAPRDAEWIERNLATLQKMGLGVEEFGRHTFKLESLPPFLSGAEPASALAGRDRQSEIGEQQQLALAARRRDDREDGLPSRGQSERPAALSGSGKIDPRSARLRVALLLPARPADHDPDFVRRAGEKVRAQSVARSTLAKRRVGPRDSHTLCLLIARSRELRQSLTALTASALLPVLRDQRFDRRRLQPVIFLFVARQFREPFPPIHPRDGRSSAAADRARPSMQRCWISSAFSPPILNAHGSAAARALTL